MVLDEQQRPRPMTRFIDIKRVAGVTYRFSPLFFAVVLATRCGIGYRIQTQAHLLPMESGILIPNDVIFRLDFGLLLHGGDRNGIAFLASSSLKCFLISMIYLAVRSLITVPARVLASRSACKEMLAIVVTYVDPRCKTPHLTWANPKFDAVQYLACGCRSAGRTVFQPRQMPSSEDYYF
jgi:hypothetical protein